MTKKTVFNITIVLYFSSTQDKSNPMQWLSIKLIRRRLDDLVKLL